MLRVPFLGLVALLLFSLDAEADEPIRVFVSILPQAQLVEKIGGERVEVFVLVQPGQSPATYSPTPKQLAELSRARLFVRVGVPFEHGFIDKVLETYPKLEIVDQRKGVTILHSHSHDHHGHAHDVDPHIWLDPKRLKTQAKTIAEALGSADPSNQAHFNANLLRLTAKLEALDRRIEQVLEPFKNQTLLCYHPAYGYFADSYGLRQVAVEAGGKEPGAKQLARIIDQARKIGAKVVFVQPQFSKKSAALVAQAIGGTVLPMDPLARDVLSNLENMAKTVAQSLTRER
jgi:zinc transport system substrate-binding protein